MASNSTATIQTPYDAFVAALGLAITAPTDELAAEVMEYAYALLPELSAEERERGKADALVWAENFGANDPGVE